MSANPPAVNDVFDDAPQPEAPQIQVENLESNPPADERLQSEPERAALEPPASSKAPVIDNTKVSKTTNVNIKNIVSIQRSNLLTNNDRHQQELAILKPLEVGTGLTGTRKIDLLQRKIETCNIDSKKKLPQNDQLIELLYSDGLYIDGSLEFKNKDINVQKLEERLLNTGQKEYFKHNGEIKINNDLLADELTRPADLAFEQTDAFQTVEQNAIVTDRLNSFKKRYYRIDIIVGKLLLKKYKQVFSPECQMMIDLKQLCKVYDRRVSLALIPFYKDRIEFLNEEIYNKQSNEDTPKKDVEFLKKMRENIMKDLQQEKKEISKAAQEIYQLWQEIEKERGKSNPSTFYDLKVHQGNDGSDVLFNLVKRNVQGNPAGLVKDIKTKCENTFVYCKLKIDGMEVASTRKVAINWPSFEVDILDQFQIFVFTLPNKVQLELFFNEQQTDIIDLVIPGSHVKSLTSASRLIKEYEFSKRQLYIEQQLARGIDLMKDQNEMTKEEKDHLKKEVEKMEKMDLDGSMFVKAEWDGYGDQMPPARSESIFAMNKGEKNRNYYTKEEQHTIFKEQRPIDVNDPRNEEIIRSIQQMKNDYLDRLLTNDSKFQLHDIESFRHKLLKARMNDPAQSRIPIPQVNSELINGEVCKYYVDWLEDVHRDETFKAYLALKQEQEQNVDPSSSDRNALSAGMFDAATQQRRLEIFEAINKRRKIAQQGISSNQQVPYNSIISEIQFEPGENLLELLVNLFTFQRKLKPKVKKRQVQSYESLPECKMLFHVIRATDVPIRLQYYEDYTNFIMKKNDDQEQGKGGQSQFEYMFQEKQVETFVEIKLVDTETGQETVLKTQAAEGQFPEWNEILAYTLRAKNKMAFTKAELEQSPIVIYFTLFDQLIQQEQITKMRTMTYRENRFLGYFSVPLTTILKGSKFEGQIRLERPLVLQGYRVIEDDLVFMEKQGLEEQERRNEEQIPTYLNVTISLEPLITLPRENEKEYYQGFEKGPFLQVGSEWVKELEIRFRKTQRQYKVFLENIQGQSVFIPKYLTPLRPHESIYFGKTDNKGIEKAARFVSLIPYLEDSTLFKDMPDLTCTSQQFLDLGMGDSEEHAMLLCNYFNFIDRDQGRQQINANDVAPKLNIQSFIVYGEAVPNGECWFVARIDLKTHNIELWNPMNGECYAFGSFNEDPVCPLKRLWFVVGQENVWANIQEDEIPAILNWELENVRMWCPFLDKKLKEAYFKGGVQSEQIQTPLEYAKPLDNIDKITMLEQQIKKYLAGKFEDERIAQVKKTTNWDINVGDDLRKVMTNDMNDEDTKNKLENVIDKVEADQKEQSRHGAWNPVSAKYQRYYAGKELAKVLIDFEDFVLNARKGGTDSKLRKAQEEEGKRVCKDEDIRCMAVQEFLNEIAGGENKKVFAIPLNVTLTSLEGLWDVLKNCRMHEIDSQDVEFSLSVMLKPYPCNVFSVWIYIAVFRDADLDDY